MARLVFFALLLLFVSTSYSCAPNAQHPQNKGNVTPSTTEPPRTESTPNENQQAVNKSASGPVPAPKVAEKVVKRDYVYGK
ncbi:hypothetical protein QR680_018191 [Steinernema hermaphroditum]|uniref:Uncharacterized protein n=1 Tax=Steinernema hermaphroditum TaxID=289476 RepID=A0AA39LPZ1_9BILA|nr:hypothetical protein QR680_018191 [Steinernema hermaphroditum]